MDWTLFRNHEYSYNMAARKKWKLDGRLKTTRGTTERKIGVENVESIKTSIKKDKADNVTVKGKALQNKVRQSKEDTR